MYIYFVSYVNIVSGVAARPSPRTRLPPAAAPALATVDVIVGACTTPPDATACAHDSSAAALS